MISVVLAIVLFSVPRGTCAIVVHLWWCASWFSVTLWCAVPTADIGFRGFGTGPLTRLIIGGIIGGVIPLCVLGINEESDMLMLYWGVQMRGMSDKGRMGRGGVSVWHAGLLVETRACEPPDSGVVAVTGTSGLHCTVVASASPM